MTRKTKQELKPKLRFPEFRDEPEWEQKRLEQICDINPTNEGLPESFIYIDLESVESGRLGQPSRISRNDAPSRAQRLLSRNDIIYQTVRPYQRNNLLCDFADNDQYVASTGYAQLRAHDSHSFLYQLVHTNPFVNKVLQKCTGSNYPAINPSSLATINIAVPLTVNEQQIIADCLTSLDELIAAHGRKLEALKVHKKGLTQQLFPRQGETQPRLRFPEFRDAPEWEEKEVGDVFQVTRGDVLAMTLVNEDKTKETPYPVYSSRTKNNGLSGYYSEYLYDNAITWTTDGANAGDVNYRGETFYCTNVCGVLINTDGYANSCIAALINRVSRQHVSYVGNPKLMNGVMAKITISFPEVDEQHKIADFLSSFDNLITSQTQTLDTLKAHKKGLMQQLFPSLEESEA